jgi:oligoribonuclease NrnB/cAMP/cGMP phosphodiesterase (DHH superfamily)
MSTLERMCELYNENRLGSLIAEKFNGEVGHWDKEACDIDFIVVFSKKTSTPTVDDLEKVIQEEYSEKEGFNVKCTGNSAIGTIDLVVRSKEGSILMVATITTFYPNSCNGWKASVRVTTSVL